MKIDTNKRRLVLLISIVIVAISGSLFASSNIEIVAAKGQFQFPFFDTKTPVWQYNNQIPGPIIRAKEGSILTVNFANQLDEPTTIHWHGLRIDNAMDGVPGVTQEAIQPGDKFIYRLGLEEAGTYWYHPHFNNSEQLERGLKGVLIVEEKEVQPWSKELILLMDDWRLQKDGTIYPKFNTPSDLMHDGRWGNVPTINGEVKPDFLVNPGERIRLRLINGANARVFLPNFDGISAEIIAVDGRPVSKVFPLTKFYLSPGNRIDLDVTIPKDAGGKTFILEDRFPRNKYLLATLTVSNEPTVLPPTFTPQTAEEFIPAKIFDNVAISKTWDLNAFRGGKLGIGWGMNKQLWPESDRADLQLGQPQKVVFQNSSGRLHPMHIHGVFFRVLERNGEPAVEQFTRDTVLVGPKETVVIGLVPEHRGIWVTHCHILEHAEAGMMTAIAINGQDQNKKGNGP